MVALPQYAPIYRLTINGQEIPAAARNCITSIRYEDGLDGADQVQITFANPELRFLQSHIRGLSVLAPPKAQAPTSSRSAAPAAPLRQPSQPSRSSPSRRSSPCR